jgi:hypothetical protein
VRACNRDCTVSWHLIALDGSTYLQVDFGARKDWPHRSPDGTCVEYAVHAWPSCSSLDRISSAVSRVQVELFPPAIEFISKAVAVCRVQLPQSMANGTGRHAATVKREELVLKLAEYRSNRPSRASRFVPTGCLPDILAYLGAVGSAYTAFKDQTTTCATESRW